MIVHLQTNPPYNSTKEKSEENKKKKDEYDSESYQYKYINLCVTVCDIQCTQTSIQDITLRLTPIQCDRETRYKIWPNNITTRLNVLQTRSYFIKVTKTTTEPKQSISYCINRSRFNATSEAPSGIGFKLQEEEDLRGDILSKYLYSEDES